MTTNHRHLREPVALDVTGALAAAVSSRAAAVVFGGALALGRVIGGRIGLEAPGSIPGAARQSCGCIVRHHYCCEWIPPRKDGCGGC
ncbi:MAG: hypothetical protein GY947_05295 [Rhodobacteraceae bacterium]|nr:hypothetical protein [Paracoccaceae bacterium]